MFSIFKDPASRDEFKIPALFCMDCFHSNKSPGYYSLCRSRFSQKERHIKSFHPGKSVDSVNFISAKAVEAKPAMVKWRAFRLKKKVSVRLVNC